MPAKHPRPYRLMMMRTKAYPIVVEASVRSNEVGDDVRLRFVLLLRRGLRSLCAPAALLSLVKPPPPTPPSEAGFFFRRGMSADGAEAPVLISILFFVLNERWAVWDLLFLAKGKREKMWSCVFFLSRRWVAPNANSDS